MSNSSWPVVIAMGAIGAVFYGVYAMTASESAASVSVEVQGEVRFAQEREMRQTAHGAQTSGTDEPSTRGAGGLGMTYSGRIGIEIVPGLVMTTSGSLQPGFGF